MSNRFPSPWRMEAIPGGFVVRDANRKPVAHVYGHDEPLRCEGVSTPLTINEAREMALSLARLPEILLERHQGLQDSDQHPLESVGREVKRSRFDPARSTHSVSADQRVPRLHGHHREKRPR